MKTYQSFITETANTVLADINEIATGLILNKNIWFDPEAKKQYEMRIAQVSKEQLDDAVGKAEAMAAEFIKWAKANGYSGDVKKVWWTARPGSMSAAVGEKVDQKKNPTDILIQFTSGPANGFLGLSAKATKQKGDIGFKNPGIGTVDKSLGLDLGGYAKDQIAIAIKDFGLPVSASARKTFIRSNSDIKSKTDQLV